MRNLNYIVDRYAQYAANWGEDEWVILFLMYSSFDDRFNLRNRYGKHSK